MAQKHRLETGTVTPFFRLANRHISDSLRRFATTTPSASVAVANATAKATADADMQVHSPYGFSSLGDLALYAMIGTVLSNPSFTYAHGGLQHLLLRHMRNRYFSLHNAFRRITHAGYLRRTRIPEGKNCFHDYYTLAHSAACKDGTAPADRCLSFEEGRVFRSSYQPFLPPTEDYTEVSIPMLMDPSLSLGAKGLYIVIARYLRLKQYQPKIVLSKDMFRAVCPEGSNAFDRMFRELRIHGYLTLTRERNPQTGYPYYGYVLHKTPDTDTVSSAHAMTVQTQSPPCPTESPSVSSQRPEKLAFPGKIQFPVEDQHAVHVGDTVSVTAPTPVPVSVSDIRAQIEYACLAADYPAERLDCIVSILHTYLSPPRAGDAQNIPIGGVSYPREVLTARFSALDSEDIRYVLDTYHDVTKTQKIRSVRRYLTTCLFHAKENLALALDAFAIRTPGFSAP